MRYMRRAATSLLMLTIGTGCGTSVREVIGREVAPVQIMTSVDVKSAFLETIAENGVRRWGAAQVRIMWSGPQSSADRSTLERAIAWLQTIEGVPELELVERTMVGAAAEVVIHRADRSEWSALLGAVESRDSADGVTVTEWGADGALRSATIVLDDASPQYQRNRTIVHELIHAMGMGHHSCAGGLVYGGGDYSPVWEPSTFDTALVELLYNTALESGELYQAVSPRLVNGEGGPACPAVEWQSVTVKGAEDGSLWCQVGPDPRLCQEARDSTGPDRGAEVVAWLQQGTAYDHDPRLFITFSLDGARVLCEKPDGSGRTPCEKTDNNTLTAPTMWTDGVELYQTPA
jgi:hypothetical protein